MRARITISYEERTLRCTRTSVPLNPYELVDVLGVIQY